MSGRPALPDGPVDDLVIGAGSAGAVVAARLSEDPARRVLLLEAGPDHTSAATPPAIAGGNFLAACALADRTWPDLLARRTPAQEPRLYLRGRGAGGSSSVNAMCALWGSDADYAAWGFPPDELAAARARVTARLPRRPRPREAWTPFERAAADAALDTGVAWCPDPDVIGSEGVGPAPLTMVEGRRVSTNDAYLEEARARPNLAVLGGAEVDRLRLDGRRATGARLLDGPDVAAGRVVVCAGAICSPALLLRSGVDQPEVGAHLLEHPSAAFGLQLRPGARVGDPDATLVNIVLRYTSDLADGGPQDMQMLFLGTTGPDGAAAGVAVAQVAVMAACSEGSVGIDADGRPVVDFALLSDERDRVRLRDGARRLWALLQHPAVAAVGDLAPPGVDLTDDAALDAWLQANTGDYVHAAGTCRLGSVVGADGAVRGYEGLHVIDASAMPLLPRANTHLSTVLLAELMVARLR